MGSGDAPKLDSKVHIGSMLMVTFPRMHLLSHTASAYLELVQTYCKDSEPGESESCNA